jgi:hypothetical protein
MREIGLILAATGEVGGKETGQKMSHLIDEAGNFKRSCQSLLASHPAIFYSDRAHAENDTRKKKLASKTKYTCPTCGLNAWAKPDVRFVCGDCHAPMQSEADIWADYDPEKAREGLRKSAGALQGVDSAALKRDIRDQRGQDSHGRPA